MFLNEAHDLWLLTGLAAAATMALVLIGGMILFRRQLLRKTTEISLQNEALKQAEERYRRLFELEADPHVMVDSDTGKILDVNQAAVILYGYSREEWLGLKHTDVSAEPDETRKAATNGTTRIPVRWHRKKDGTVFPVEITACHFEWQGRKVHEASIRDITERKKAEDMENQLRQAQKMDSIGRLAGGVAHDFNNILMAIIGNAELALESLPDKTPVRTDVEEILRNSRRAADLTRQLLAFARRQSVNPRVLKPNELILNLGRMLQRLIGEHITLKTELAGDHPHIKADPTQIEQVLVNMVVNARDAMPDGGTLTLQTHNMTHNQNSPPRYQEMPEGEYVSIMIRDTGTGIPEEVRQHIFEPFFTTKVLGKGTGLGLATCFGIIRQSGGYIGFDSEIDKGTTFEVCLPRCRETPAPAHEEPLRKTRGGTETVLLAEDDKDMRQVVLRALRGQGYQVLEAVNGTDALALADRHPGEIHLLLSDVIMPEMNGPTLAEHLTQLRPTLRIIFISGYTDNALVGEAIAKYRGLFIEKPFSLSSLLSKVRETLNAA